MSGKPPDEDGAGASADAPRPARKPARPSQVDRNAPTMNEPLAADGPAGPARRAARTSRAAEDTVPAAPTDAASTVPWTPGGASAGPTAGPAASPAAAPRGGGTDALVGEVLGGCKIERLLGKGGMALVYLGRQVELDREVAVKVLSPRLTQDPKQVEQFMHEAKTLAKLEHANIVSIYGVGKEKDAPFLVLQLVTGGSLHDLLEKRKRVTVAEACAFTRQIALGLAEAHRKGIVHRDIKPGNVMVAAGPTMKITDFGLAQFQSDPTARVGAGMIQGTPFYMPPEQADGRGADARSDVYSLGATFYHLLTGAPPFVGEPMEVLVKHITEPLTPPHERAQDVPAAVSRIACRMLAKAPEDRYATLDEVVRDLDAGGAAGVEAPAAPVAKRPEVPRAESLLSPGQLPDMRSLLRPIPPPRPRYARHALGGLAAVACLTAGALLGPIATVLADLQTTPDEVAAAVAERTAVLALDAIEAARPEPALAARRYRALAADYPRTASAAEAERRAGAADDELARARAAALDAVVSRARELAGRGSPGPALDALRDALPPAADHEAAGAGSAGAGHDRDAERATEGAVRALAAELRADLERRGLAWISPGPFRSGDHPRDVELPGFYLDRREVTVEQFAAFVAGDGTTAPAAWQDGRPRPGTEALPVTGVSYEQAAAFARGRGMRLPTALEWEKAARGPGGGRWPWGDAVEPTRCNWRGSGGGRPQPPGSFPDDVSPYGCLDLAGNVAELTTAPGARTAVWVRGGSCLTRTFLNTRAAFYFDDLAVTEGHEGVGFRCASDALPAEGGAPR